ncbi:MAG: molybdate ABC transporter permease subunit [Paenibacillaceae bacterium]
MGTELWEPVWLSVRITAVSSIIVFIIAIAIARVMAKRQFYGKTALETLFLLPLVLPPTVVGFLLLVILGRNSWIGQAIQWLTNQPIVFTWMAAVIASTVVAFPLVYQSVKTGFTTVDTLVEDAARSAGATEWQLFRWITVPLSKRFLISAYVLGFARGLGEFGATLMVAGNIPGRTQTIPTAIYIAVDSGRVGQAWFWTIIVVLLSFLLLLMANRVAR